MRNDDEIRALRAELEEARQTLEAIRAGEVDALVGEGGSRAQPLYTRTSAERIYRLIIERMVEGAVTLSDQGVVLHCNRAFSEMVARPASDVVGKRVASWLVATEEVSLEQLLSLGPPVRGDFDLVMATGARVPVSVSASSIEDGRSHVRCLVVSDLRQRRDAARLREVTAELRAANERKDQFLAMLGHELRNPLAPIRQATELLDLRCGPDEPQYVRNAREVISRQVVHLTRIIDDLLDAGRIAQGTLVIRPASVDLRHVIAGAVESVDRLVGRRGHTIDVQIPDERVQVRGDDVRLTQIVTNLLSNAAKYSDDGGRIEVRLESRQGWHVITIRDEGRGIRPDLMPHLFEPFVRGQTTSGWRQGGLGVGLSLVQRLVELHEGRVEAHSDGIGRGSEFRVFLPIDDAGPGRDVAPRVEAEAPPARILVVDDNEDAADMLTLVLRSGGHSVEVAYDGEEALEKEADFRPDVVCLDIGLPGADGYEVARRLRSKRGRDIKLIALTGYGSEADRARASNAGFDHHFVKPVDGAEIERVLSE